MVLRFKLHPSDRLSHEISIGEVEERIARRAPWFVGGTMRDDDRHFAVCPGCDNPIQLKGLYRGTGARRPYGSHVGKPVDQVGRHDLARLQFCPYKIRKKPGSPDDLREPSEADKEIIAFVREEFDRIVMILRDDLGFRLSANAAEKMLQHWFLNRGYLYTHINFMNLPWMVLYLSRQVSLYGQRGFVADIRDNIERLAPTARFNDRGQLEAEGRWLDLTLQALHHDVTQLDDGSFTETMKLRIRDYTDTNLPSRAPIIWETTITFNHQRFERLVGTPAERARRDDRLLAIARKVLGDLQ